MRIIKNNKAKFSIMCCAIAILITVFMTGCAAKQEGKQTNNPEKKIRDGFSALIKANTSERQLFEYIDQNIANLDKKNLSDMVYKLVKYQEKRVDSIANEITKPEIAAQLSSQLSGRIVKRDEIVKIKNSSIRNSILDLYAGGYELVMFEGTYYPVINYSKYITYNGNIDEQTKAFIQIMARESSDISMEDAAIIIPVEDVFTRALSMERFLKDYPQSQYAGDVKSLYDTYVTAYLLGANNTPAFSYDTNTLDKQFEVSYLSHFNKEFTQNASGIKGKMYGYILVLQKNDYKNNSQVEAYRKQMLADLTK